MAQFRFDIQRPNPMLALQAAGMGERMRMNRLATARADEQMQMRRDAAEREQQAAALEAKRDGLVLMAKGYSEIDPSWSQEQKDAHIAGYGRLLQQMYPGEELEPGEGNYDPRMEATLRGLAPEPAAPGKLVKTWDPVTETSTWTPASQAAGMAAVPPSPLVSIDQRQPPNVGAGRVAVRDPTSPSGYRAELVPGSEPARKAAEEQSKAQSTIAMGRQRLDRVRSLANKAATEARGLDWKALAAQMLPGGPEPQLPTAGFFGGALSAIGGTAAKDLAGTLQTIRANVGFEQLAELRSQGGTLGQVSNVEGEKLDAAYANLDQSQSPEQLQENLVRLVMQAEQTWRRISDAYERQYGQPYTGEQPSGQMNPIPSSETVPRAVGDKINIQGFTIERIE